MQKIGNLKDCFWISAIVEINLTNSASYSMFICNWFVSIILLPLLLPYSTVVKMIVTITIIINIYQIVFQLYFLKAMFETYFNQIEQLI